MFRVILVWIATTIVLSACSSANLSSMYPEPVGDQPIGAEMAVVLVGNAGPATINYLQFVHSSIPAINARDINLPPDGIVAIPVPVGTKRLYLADYTTTGQNGGYLPNGTAYGFVRVETPNIDIDARGIYYIATLLPGQRPNYEIAPKVASLSRFRATHPQLAQLPPVNFAWPK